MERITGIAVVAAAHSDVYAATGRLLGLLTAVLRSLAGEGSRWPDRPSRPSTRCPAPKAQAIRELWLRDLALTTWHVLRADHRSHDPAGRKAFLGAWTSI
ncbi:hypothetical protein GCM10009837_42480 [Streptomyces durmitorensis]|uniref:Uncharacterized protein n=1 Tax=Streptomyces durmitorensis TaxID=319947 RepID=A0ABY4Q3H1_9ACTN|nr:hypothetical protein [Streptomyces durmitorensis]UQT60728.1 hypothetical protein M4V62_39800 [Streptomyces durmitorensis]